MMQLNAPSPTSSNPLLSGCLHPDRSGFDYGDDAIERTISDFVEPAPVRMQAWLHSTPKNTYMVTAPSSYLAMQRLAAAGEAEMEKAGTNASRIVEVMKQDARKVDSVEGRNAENIRTIQESALVIDRAIKAAVTKWKTDSRTELRTAKARMTNKRSALNSSLLVDRSTKAAELNSSFVGVQEKIGSDTGIIRQEIAELDAGLQNSKEMASGIPSSLASISASVAEEDERIRHSLGTAIGNLTRTYDGASSSVRSRVKTRLAERQKEMNAAAALFRSALMKYPVFYKNIENKQVNELKSVDA